MRAFVALLPTPDVAADLERVIDPRRDAGGPPRWSDPAQHHLTLSFMDDVPSAALDGLSERLRAVAESTPPFPIRLAGAGAFPDTTRAKVLYAAVTDPVDALTSLSRKVRAACSAAGARPDGAAYRPHVTIARFTRPTEATRWIRAFDGWEGPSWDVREMALVGSHGVGVGHRRRHEVLDRWELSRS